MTKQKNDARELSLQQLDQLSGGWVRPHRQPPELHFRNPEMQIAHEMQGQFNAANSALRGFSMPSIL